MSAEHVEADEGRIVSRRIVFYIPGFDPFPARRYRELYRKEGADQAAISGYRLQVGPAPSARAGGFAWKVDAAIEGHDVRTRFEILGWNDLVQAAMPAGLLSPWVQLWRAARVYIGRGALWPLLRLRKGPVLATAWPVGMLIGQMLTALLAIWLCLRLGDWLALSPWLMLLPGLLVATGLLWLFARLDRRLFVHYLMNDFAYGCRHDGADPPELRARLGEFATAIRAALLEPDIDEVLVVGHSSGAHLGVSVLADLLREGLPDDGARLSFLTLGEAIPMVSCLPRADELRRDLHLLGHQDRIPWVDVTAPSDGCTFALCDPLAFTGQDSPAQKWPLILSAAFTRTLSPERMAAMRWRFFRRHFQYLCAFDRLPDEPDAYDYFRITAGPRTLWGRMGRRRPSAGVIRRTLSRYRDMAA